MQDEFKIGDFTIKPRILMISRSDVDVHVEPKTMDLLVYLAHNAGDLVEKDHLLSEVWADYFVTEDVLSNTVWKLRQAFHDDPRKPRYIETIYKKGYRIVAPVHFPERMRSEIRLSPAVGHESEHSELQKCYDAVESGSTILVCISGEAGIGKTTFVENFLHLHFHHNCFIGRGKCSEHLAAGAAYLPVIEALDNLTLSSPDSDLARLLKQTAPSWHLWVYPNTEDATPVAVAGAGAAPELMKRELTEFMSNLSERHPVLLFLDDAHWSDASSIDLLIYLLDHCSSSRVMVLMTYRPEILMAADHPLINLTLRLKAQGVCREIPLPLLKGEDVSAYIDLTFPNHCFPAGFAESIHERTEGNPLFMVDLLAHFRRRELIGYDEEKGCWTVRRPVDPSKESIPDSIESLIRFKIRNIGQSKQDLLACASVQGPEFDSAVVAKTLGIDQSRAEEQLQELERIHGLVRRLESGSTHRLRAPFERYQFIHILYREALVDTLSPGQRAELSGSVAKSICEVHGDAEGPYVSQASFLFEAAGALSNAAKYRLIAARRTIRISAYLEAMASARKGLDMLDRIESSEEHKGARLELQMIFALALTQLKGYAYPEVRESYIRSYDLCVREGESIQASRCLLAIGSYWLACCNLKETMKVCRQYHRLPEHGRNQILEIWFYLISCSAISHWGDLAQALDYGRGCVAFSDSQTPGDTLAFGDFEAGSIGRLQLARILCLCGYADQARLRAEEALSTVRSLDHPYTLAFALFMGSWLFHYLDENERSLEYADEVLQIAARHGFLMHQGWAHAVRGQALTHLGKPKTGIEEIEKAIQIFGEIGWRYGQTELLGTHALALSQSGNAGAALAALDKAFDLLKETGEAYYECELNRIKARILRKSPASADGTKIEACLRHAIGIARKQGAKWFELRAASDLAQYYAHQDRPGDGHRVLHTVLEWFTEGFDTADLQRAARLLKRLKS
jgi:DNA-binding winged helix-turn-helix (wHTH) protein/tetratricopeptide (TPR) repeat protein